jgi:hypothetical protein
MSLLYRILGSLADWFDECSCQLKRLTKPIGCRWRKCCPEIETEARNRNQIRRWVGSIQLLGKAQQRLWPGSMARDWRPIRGEVLRKQWNIGRQMLGSIKKHGKLNGSKWFGKFWGELMQIERAHMAQVPSGNRPRRQRAECVIATQLIAIAND